MAFPVFARPTNETGDHRFYRIQWIKRWGCFLRKCFARLWNLRARAISLVLLVSLSRQTIDSTNLYWKVKSIPIIDSTLPNFMKRYLVVKERYNCLASANAFITSARIFTIDSTVFLSLRTMRNSRQRPNIFFITG